MKKIISNNKFILTYVMKHGKIFAFMSIISIFIQVFSDYIGMNMSRWLFDNISYGTEKIIRIIVIFSTVSVFMNLCLHVIRLYITQFEEFDINNAMMIDIVEASFGISQEEMEDPEFYNTYKRGIAEASGRVRTVVSTIRNILYGICSLIMVLYLVTDINIYISVFLLLSSVVSTVISQITNKIEYNKYVQSTIADRKYSYIIRLIFQPEYSKTIRLANTKFKQLLVSYLNKNIFELKNITKKYRSKYLILGIAGELNEFLFRRIIPFVVCVISLYSETITIGEASVLMAAVSMLPNIYSIIFNSFIDIGKNSMYIDNFMQIIKHKKCNENDMQIASKSSNEISVQNVSFAYNHKISDNYVLYKISMQIPKNNIVAVVGINGAGKTTLAMLLAGLYKTKDGCIIIGNKALNSYSKDEIATKIAVMTQETHVFGFSVIENVLMRKPEKREDYDLVIEALTKVGLYEKIMNSKYQLDSKVTKEFDEFGIEFSGGEKQRLALARVYVSQADIVILDEPTSSLDVYNENLFFELISDLLKNKTVVLISHRLEYLKEVEKIYLIDKGVIVEEGKHNELMQNKDKYYRMYINNDNLKKRKVNLEA